MGHALTFKIIVVDSSVCPVLFQNIETIVEDLITKFFSHLCAKFWQFKRVPVNVLLLLFLKVFLQILFRNNVLIRLLRPNRDATLRNHRFTKIRCTLNIIILIGTLIKINVKFIDIINVVLIKYFLRKTIAWNEISNDFFQDLFIIVSLFFLFAAFFNFGENVKSFGQSICKFVFESIVL